MAYGVNNKAYSNQKNWSDTYLTDPKIIEILGPFDTDPCCPSDMPWKTASVMYSLPETDGLQVDWKGRVWINPPYRGVKKWMERFTGCESGIALLNGRSVETEATQLAFCLGYGVLFPRGRLTFYKQDGEPWPDKWFPSVLVGLTDFDFNKLRELSFYLGGSLFKAVY